MSFTFPIIQKEGDFVNTITPFCLFLSMMAWKGRVFVGIKGAFCHHFPFLLCTTHFSSSLYFFCYEHIQSILQLIHDNSSHAANLQDLLANVCQKPEIQKPKFLLLSATKSPCYYCLGYKCRHLFTLRHFHPSSSKVAGKSVLKT